MLNFQAFDRDDTHFMGLIWPAFVIGAEMQTKDQRATIADIFARLWMVWCCANVLSAFKCSREFGPNVPKKHQGPGVNTVTNGAKTGFLYNQFWMIGSGRHWYPKTFGFSNHVKAALQLILSQGLIPYFHKRAIKAIYWVMVWGVDSYNLFSQEFHVLVASAVVVAPFWSGLRLSILVYKTWGLKTGKRTSGYTPMYL